MVDLKVRLLVIGDAVVPTGFGNVLHNIVGNLPKSDYDIRWLGVNYRGDPHPYSDLKIYPATLNNPSDIYGFSRLESFKEFKPHIIFLLNDAWILDNYLARIKEIFKNNMPKIVTYVPVDAADHDPRWYIHFDAVSRVVAYTEFGKTVLNSAISNIVTDVIPHGSSKTFYKMEGTKESIRKLLVKARPEIYNSFIFLNANRNQPRKRLDITIDAFRLFREGKGKDEVKLYMHCGTRDSAIDIIEYCRRRGVDSDLILSSVTEGIQLLSPNHLNIIYNACDAGLNTGLGEGWGLTNFEHAITGAPQIVGDHSSLHEIYKDSRGILVPVSLPYTLDMIMTRGSLVSAEDVASAMETVYRDANTRDIISSNFINTYNTPEYSWESISKSWHKLFVEVANS